MNTDSDVGTENTKAVRDLFHFLNLLKLNFVWIFRVVSTDCLSCLFPRKHNYVNLFRFSTSRDFEFVRL